MNDIMESSCLLNRGIYEERRVGYIIRELFRNLICRFSGRAGNESGSLSRTEEINATAVRILNLYENDILRMAYSYLHNMEDAEDIVQDTVICYWQKAPQNMDMAKEKAWLLTVASNLSKNKIRYKKLRKTDELLDTLAQEEREDLFFVWEAVKTLPIKYREAVHLFYYEGYSTCDIAQILHRNESSVRSDLRRGREQLRKILKEAYDFE